MAKKQALVLFILLAVGLSCANARWEPPDYKWVASNEFYFLLPAPQKLYLPEAKDTAVVHPWGLGLRAVGNGEKFHKTGALQLQQVKLSDRSLPDADPFYIFDFLAGLEYMSPKVDKKPLRFTASVLADFGFSSNFFMAPVISAGLLYDTNEAAEKTAGLTFSIFYRPTEIELNDVGGGKKGTLRPAIGFKAGYIFEGFWSPNDKY